MAPRRQQAAQAAPSLLSLPPEVLLHILASVPLADRLSRVALACKQLGTLCTAPALLSELDVCISGDETVTRTRALLCFLARHGGRTLRLDIQTPNALLESSKAEVAALVCACLATCAVPRGQPGNGLRRLSLSPDTPLPSTSCLPLLTALEELHLPGRFSNFFLGLDGSWRQLTALRSAHLSGYLWRSQPGPCLPPSLTRLRIEGDLTDTDPDDPPVLDANVLAGLPQLRCLELQDSAYAGDSLAAISSLTTLTRLVLHLLEEPPPSAALAALAPTLRSLEVHSLWVEEDLLEEALQALTALECLAFDLGRLGQHMPSVPNAVAALPHLQCCALTFYDINSSQSLQGGLLGPLPALPFAALRWLALPLQLAVSHYPRLAQAGRLHTFCVIVPAADDAFDETHWTAFWKFLAGHPPLRCLLYEVPAEGEPGPDIYMLLDALLLLKSQRPALEMRRLTAPDDRIVHEPACWAEMRAQVH